MWKLFLKIIYDEYSVAVYVDIQRFNVNVAFCKFNYHENFDIHFRLINRQIHVHDLTFPNYPFLCDWSTAKAMKSWDAKSFWKEIWRYVNSKRVKIKQINRWRGSLGPWKVFQTKQQKQRVWGIHNYMNKKSKLYVQQFGVLPNIFIITKGTIIKTMCKHFV